PNELASPIIVSGGAITPCGAGGVESSNGEQHETSKAESPNTSKPASSAPLNAPAQALSGDETKRRTFRARRGRRPAVKQPPRRRWIRFCRVWARVPAGIANARARSVAAPIANREQQKSTAEGRKCGQLFSVEREGGAPVDIQAD